ncbi:MAG: DUF4402 domain-containing protein [Bacteroidales bacterium]
MKKLFLSLAIVLISFAAFAQNNTVIPMSAGIELANMVSATKMTDVYFGGAYIPLKGTATVEMGFGGYVTVKTGDISLFNQASQKLGSVRIQGQTQAQLQISIDKTTVTLTDNIQNGDEPVTTVKYVPVLFDNEGNKVDLTSAPVVYSEARWSNIYVGGSVDIPSESYRGVYTGDFNITITWI